MRMLVLETVHGKTALPVDSILHVQLHKKIAENQSNHVCVGNKWINVLVEFDTFENAESKFNEIIQELK